MTTTTAKRTAVRPLEDMKLEVYKVNQANGWFDDDRTFGDDLALSHSEVSEMFEAYRDWGYEDMTERLAPEQSRPAVLKPQGFANEAADVLIRLLDTAYREDVSFHPEATLEDVSPHPEFSDDYTVGTHITILHEIISKMASAAADDELTLTPLLSYLVTWCNHLGIDLQAEFDRKLEYNATRGHRHGGKLL